MQRTGQSIRVSRYRKFDWKFYQSENKQSQKMHEIYVHLYAELGVR